MPRNMLRLLPKSKDIFSWSYHPASASRRLTFTAVCFVIWFAIVAGRLFQITFISESKTQAQALLSQRRQIVDRFGNPLAVNLPIGSLFAYPHKISNPQAVAHSLCQIFDQNSYKATLAKLKSKKHFVWLKREISPQEQELVNALGLNGIESVNGYKRFYPYGNLLSHIIGYVGIDGVGLAGIERGSDKILTTADADPLELSIDIYLQNIVAEELKAAKEHFGARAGGAIVADVNTGEILAFVNEPNFDPNKITATDQEALMNQNALGVYELGSIFKPIITAIGLDSGIIDLHDVYDITELKVGKHNVTDFNESAGWYTLARLFAKSSNKGMSQIGLEIGEAKIREYLKDFGLLGAIPHIEIPEKARPIYPIKYPWSNLTVATVSYGYALSISPLHYIQAMIPIVNGGNKLPLTVFKCKSAPEGTRILKESTSEKLRILMRLAVSHGTCKLAFVPGQDVGCKTGTANKIIKGKYCKSVVRCSSIGAFPINQPKYLVFVSLDEPKPNTETGKRVSASLTAAPIIGKIVSRIAARYGLKEQERDYSNWQYLIYGPQ